MREVIQLGDTLKVAVFHFFTRSYATRTNVLSDSSDNQHYTVGKADYMKRSRLPALPMTGSERRAAVGLAGIFALRMLGLFLILPVFALYAQGMIGATPLLIGIAVGVYGLTQAVLQIPFGMLSDRIGRKPVIFGLVLFTLGSLVAALAEDIGGVIAGRVLQGSGAIAAAVMALAADLTGRRSVPMPWWASALPLRWLWCWGTGSAW